jgi:hypothetical protein
MKTRSERKRKLLGFENTVYAHQITSSRRSCVKMLAREDVPSSQIQTVGVIHRCCQVKGLYLGRPERVKNVRIEVT